MAISPYKTKCGEVRYKAVVWRQHRVVKSKSFRRKIDAVEWHRRELCKLTDESVGRLRGDRLSLDEFFEKEYWKNKSISPGTACDYLRIFRVHIQPKFGKRNLRSIGSDEWSGFISNLVTNGMSKARANRVHALASAIYSKAVRAKIVVENPLKSFSWFREDLPAIRSWTESDAQRFLRWAFVNALDRFPLYQLAYETGMRCSEIIGLKRDCLDFLSGTIEVRRSHCKITKTVSQTTKSGHSRVLGMSVGLKATLQKMLASHSSEFVFINTDKKEQKLTYDVIRYHFILDQERAGVTKIGFHGIRHTFAKVYLAKGGNPMDLMGLLGHSDIETTLRYARTNPSDLKRKCGVIAFEMPTSNNVISITRNHSATMDDNHDHTVEPQNHI